MVYNGLRDLIAHRGNGVQGGHRILKDHGNFLTADLGTHFLLRQRQQIAALEERDAEIDTLLASPEVATDVGKCIKLSKEKAQISEELAALYETWEELAED